MTEAHVKVRQSMNISFGTQEELSVYDLIYIEIYIKVTLQRCEGVLLENKLQ